MFRHAPEIFKGLPNFHLRCIRYPERGVESGDALADLLAGEPLAFLLLFGQTEALGEDGLHVVRAEEGEVGTLDALHLVGREPVGRAFGAELVEKLGVELVVVDGREVVDELPLTDVDAEVASAAGGVAERVHVVGGGEEGGVASAVLLRAAEDGAPVDLDLRERLFEAALLVGAHAVKLVDVDDEVVGEGHIGIELVAEVDVVEIVGTEFFGQEAHGEGALAATLRPDEHGHALVAVKKVHAHPVGHGRTEPGGAPGKLLGGDAGDAAEEGGYVAAAVPLGEMAEEVGDGVKVGDGVGTDELLDVLSGRGVAADARLLGVAHDAVEGMGRDGRPLGAGVFGSSGLAVGRGVLAGVGEGGHLNFAAEEIAAELIVFGEEGFYLVDALLHLGRVERVESRGVGLLDHR